MNISYADESGYRGSGRSDAQPMLVLAGVLVNSYSAPKVKREIAEVHAQLEELAGSRLPELHASEMMKGHGPWAGSSIEDRAAARELILDFVDAEKLKVCVSAVTYAEFDVLDIEDGYTPYALAGLRYAVAVQRYPHRNKLSSQNKTVVLCVFDRLMAEERNLSDLLAEPPTTALEAVGRKRSRDRPGLSALWD